MILLLAACHAPAPDTGDTAAASAAPAIVANATRVEVEVGHEARLSVSATGGEVTWYFGDGETREGARTVHTWAEAGNYVAIAELRADDGRRLTATVGVEVFRTPAAIRPTWSSTLAFGYGGEVWVAVPDADLVTVVSWTAGEESTPPYKAELPTCGTPRTLASDGVSMAIACDDGGLAQWDLATDTETGRLDLGAGTHPYGVVAFEGAWWVTLAGTGELAEVRDGLVEVTPIGPDPRGIAAGDQLYVSRFRSAPDGGEIYRTDDVPLTLPVHPGPDSDTIAGGVPTLIQQLALSPDGQTLYVPALQANVGRGLLGSGEPLTFESTVRAALGVVDVDAATEDWSIRKQLDNQDRVVAVAPSPNGNYLAIAHPGTQTIQILDAFTLDAVGSIHDAGNGITGLLWQTDRLFVNASLDRALRIYELGAPGEVAVLAWTVPLVTDEPLAADVLAGKKLFAASGDPRIAKDGYIACASCHPDGENDGLTWDFTSRGEGLRNTTSLLGRAGTGMGFLHWSANFDEVQDFENDIRNAFGGTGLLTDADWAETSDTLGAAKSGRSEDLDALAAYVTSLATPPASPWAADATETSAAFDALCASCHPAPLYTDSTLAELRLHDVGTLRDTSGDRLGAALVGLDTPTLLGAWATPPYLHDGSAATLEDAIRAHGTPDLDGAGLDAATVSALTTFVRGL